MDPTIRLPTEVASLVRAHAAGVTQPAEPRRAATVILLRDGSRHVEVHLLRRARSMAFAGGRAVFPGGGLDPTDRERVRRWAGPSVEQWGAALGVAAAQAREIVTAAVRETFEECGVLLAEGSDGTELTDLTGDDWIRDRQRIAEHEMSLAELFERRALTLRSDLLRPWALWVTPEFEPRRFHTWFLLARAPQGQRTLGGAREATVNEWYDVETALRAADAETLPLLPPQYCTLLELFDFRTVDELFAAHRDLATVRPAVGIDGDGAYLILPEHLIGLGHQVAAHMYSSSEEHP